MRFRGEECLKIKELNPEAKIYVLTGICEPMALGVLHGKARKEGILFVRYVPEEKPRGEEEWRPALCSILRIESSRSRSD